MKNSEILKNIFNLAQLGIKVDIDNLPDSINKGVVYKNLLQIELERLKKINGNSERIKEIEFLLAPPIVEQEEVE